MPKTRQNKDRKQKLLNFKNQQKKKFMDSNVKAPEIRQISQVPVWSQDAKFELSGGEFMTLQNFFGVYAEPLAVVQNILKRSLDNGTIQVRYQEDGKEISKEEVEAYLQEIKDYQSAVLGEPVTENVPQPKKLKTKKESVAEPTEEVSA